MSFCRSATCQRRHDAKTWYETQTLFASIAAKHSPCTLIASPRDEASRRDEPPLYNDPIVKIIRGLLAADRHDFSGVCPCLDRFVTCRRLRRLAITCLHPTAKRTQHGSRTSVSLEPIPTAVRVLSAYAEK